MVGGVEPEPSRLEKVLRVIDQQNADILGLQETKVTKGKDNELVWAIRETHKYPYDVVFDNDVEWVQRTGAALFSKRVPSSSCRLGENVKAVEMTYPAQGGNLSISNVYLSHVSEATRLPQIQEVLQELRRNEYGILMGDFNSLSSEDGIPASAVDSFSEPMKRKYCRDGKLCYDTIEAVLEEGYIDVGLRFHKPEEITSATDLSGGTGAHTRPIRMDFIFAREGVLPYVKEFVLAREGLAWTASDHFPWYVMLEESLFDAVKR